MQVRLTPRLIVRRAADALDFYARAFGAELGECYADRDGHVVNASFSIGGQTFSLTEEKVAWNNVSPDSLGGSPVVLNLVVDDVDAVAARLVQAGAATVFPVDDQFYGRREGRFKDPFGHLWILTTIIEELTPEEIRRRMGG